jgi:hypothetical protein
MVGTVHPNFMVVYCGIVVHFTNVFFIYHYGWLTIASDTKKHVTMKTCLKMFQTITCNWYQFFSDVVIQVCFKNMLSSFDIPKIANLVSPLVAYFWEIPIFSNSFGMGIYKGVHWTRKSWDWASNVNWRVWSLLGRSYIRSPYGAKCNVLTHAG